jgi:carbonic anhydrase
MKSMIGMLVAATLAAPALAQEQSPIDIRSSDAVYAVLPPLVFNYGNDVALTVLNNGAPDPEKTVRSTPTGNNSLSISGETYNLQQFHFHINCEHLLNGQVFPMEAHFVHQSASGVYTVVGRFIEIGDENLLLKPIFDNLPQVANGTYDIASFDLSALVPTDLRSYRYAGSLTTPAYDEGVNWVVMHERLVLSQAQVDAFGALFPQGNFREVQALNGRIIQTDVRGFVPEPATWAMLIIGFGAAGTGLRRQRSRAIA